MTHFILGAVFAVSTSSILFVAMLAKKAKKAEWTPWDSLELQRAEQELAVELAIKKIEFDACKLRHPSSWGQPL
jgi:hypothetical protein